MLYIYTVTLFSVWLCGVEQNGSSCVTIMNDYKDAVFSQVHITVQAIHYLVTSSFF